jgi:hypothetical protein
MKKSPNLYALANVLLKEVFQIGGNLLHCHSQINKSIIQKSNE